MKNTHDGAILACGLITMAAIVALIAYGGTVGYTIAAVPIIVLVILGLREL